MKNLFFTIDVEEWFTSKKIVQLDERNTQYSSDVAETVSWILTLLNDHGLRGTFFFIHDIAVRYPDLVRNLIANGHEIALHGETHDDLKTVSDASFEQALKKMKSAFKRDFNVDLKGYRAPYFSIHPQAIALLKQCGFCYDSSVVPSLPIPGWYGEWKAPRTPYRIGKTLHETNGERQFLEFPLSVHPTLRLPGLGGMYFRNLGYPYTKQLLKTCLNRVGYAIFYLHPWECSFHIPRLPQLPFYMTRRCGEWTRTALRRLLQDAKEMTFESLTLENFYENQRYA